MEQKGAATGAWEAVLLGRLLWDMPILADPPAAASEWRRVEARPLAVGVLNSHGGSAGRLVLLPGLVPAPGSGTRHDTHA